MTTGGAACAGAVLGATVVGVGVGAGVAAGVGMALIAIESLAVGWWAPLPQPATLTAAANRKAAPPALTSALDDFPTSSPLADRHWRQCQCPH